MSIVLSHIIKADDNLFATREESIASVSVEVYHTTISYHCDSILMFSHLKAAAGLKYVLLQTVCLEVHSHFAFYWPTFVLFLTQMMTTKCMSILLLFYVIYFSCHIKFLPISIPLIWIFCV